MNRLLSLLLVVALILVLAVPASAAGNDSGWLELLEFTSIQSDGSNSFTINGTSGSLVIPLHGEYHLRKIDVLLWTPSGQRPTSATCTAAGSTTTLDVLAIGGKLTRIVGYIPDTSYQSIRIDLKKTTTSTQTYEVLSYKVTSLGLQEFVADASVYLDSYGTTGTYSTNYNIPLWYDSSGYSSDGSPWLARIQVNDWEKFDSLSVWGSATSASIESIRASISTTALQIDVDYIDAESYEFAVDGDPTYWVTGEWGKYLYHITIDLSGVDRSMTTEPLYIYLTGSYDISVQAYFNCQYVNGSVSTADTTNVTWWNRFTAFFTGLFGGDSTDADDFGSTMESQSSAMQDAVDQMDQVTKPPVEDLDVSLDEYMDDTSMEGVNGVLDAIFQNDLIVTMLIICLTCALCSYVLYGKR